ncbi:SRPBCC family protein [Yinghuangia seranimata]|uniref:SRPBCC family protein n=1 Tax=Yinghuangia seranimata TaxID=408067 RepID=UPI00248C2619|nr:SRPBCC family protein [Yinghuangia seranimata]MDI2124999.1 SRPBCC family protein [Yinghuangia seranimata]
MFGHWYPLTESGDVFLKSAPFRAVESVDVAAPPARSWEIMTGDSLVKWTLAFTALVWHPDPPSGPGTTREVTLLRLLTVRERFFRWEENKRYTFSAVGASLPGLRHVAEDWVVEPAPGGSRLTWTLAAQAAAPATPLLWASRPLVKVMQRHVLRAVRLHAEDRNAPRSRARSG